MFWFQFSLSSIMSPRCKHELDLGTIILSSIKDKSGKLDFGEKVIKNDFTPLKTNLTKRRQTTTESHIS